LPSLPLPFQLAVADLFIHNGFLVMLKDRKNPLSAMIVTDEVLVI
jgi:hypothetical protein